MEPDTKLFPAIFMEATSKEVLQIELGRTSTTLPLSAAVLQNSDRHVTPQVIVELLNLNDSTFTEDRARRKLDVLI
jgi:hypothetical protein